MYVDLSVDKTWHLKKQNKMISTIWIWGKYHALCNEFVCLFSCPLSRVLPVRLSIWLSTLYLHLYVHLSVYLSGMYVYLQTILPLSVYLCSVCSSIDLSVITSICHFVSPSVSSPSFNIPNCMYFCLSVLKLNLYPFLSYDCNRTASTKQVYTILFHSTKFFHYHSLTLPSLTVPYQPHNGDVSQRKYLGCC